MLESMIFLILIIVSAGSIIISVFLVLMSIFYKSKRLRKVGLLFLLIPLFSFGLVNWWYLIEIPRALKINEKRYIGNYYIENIESIKLLLEPDNTFELYKNSVIDFEGKGHWKSGGTDYEAFFFYDNNDKIVFITGFEKEKYLILKNTEKEVLFKME